MNVVSALGGWGQTLIWTIIPFLFVLTVVVFFHELGPLLGRPPQRRAGRGLLDRLRP